MNFNSGIGALTWETYFYKEVSEGECLQNLCAKLADIIDNSLFNETIVLSSEGYYNKVEVQIDSDHFITSIT